MTYGFWEVLISSLEFNKLTMKTVPGDPFKAKKKLFLFSSINMQFYLLIFYLMVHLKAFYSGILRLAPITRVNRLCWSLTRQQKYFTSAEVRFGINSKRAKNIGAKFRIVPKLGDLLVYSTALSFHSSLRKSFAKSFMLAQLQRLPRSSTLSMAISKGKGGSEIYIVM
uniref:Uncharacterized protein n=1 Tax=Glossina pallidipes TaxID=7398 RepID=A0A1B0A0Z7_GLOPL